ncbi:hypothetical protein BP6252_13753 [Coleophoma cylindrospora]|uniref:Heterokaryon incompatibility domain-containing protein n=1 Tax=Coleophoma cylindrospora TaxID=1849047 RepID=A0A3D8Q6P8_9HELO|nr:hypothetical protein BP6252_13753 [Coleophoma cylindrospora]
MDPTTGTPEAHRASDEQDAVTRGSTAGTEHPENPEQPREPSKSRSPDHKRMSIGPQILFILSQEKTEEYVAKVRTKLSSTFDNWALAKLLWHYVEEWATSEATKENFQGYLSTTQRHSYALLHDWIYSKYELESVIHPFRRSLYDMETDALIHDALDDNDSHVLNEGYRHLTLYQKVMADLFRIEFSPNHWVSEHYRKRVQHGIEFQGDEFETIDYLRLRAWQVGTAQRISWKFTLVSWNDGLDMSSTSKAFENPSRRIDYCPWLKRDKSRSGFPRYLWDIVQKKTVDTSDFPKSVEYTCISHTWGRWRKKEWVTIPGVPWRVPLNTRFDIEELPATFYNMKDRFKTNFIWLDLFCMPQETTDPQFLSILKAEIARQAVIFQNAFACVAWLNYVNHWVAEYCTIGWLSAQFVTLGSRPGMSNAESILGAADHGCYLPLQLTRLSNPTFGYPKWRALWIQGANDLDEWWRRKKKRGPYYHFEPSDWFSGVWTLQEAYLRPNMVLADKEWNVLSDASGEPISLEELFALDYVVWQLRTWGTQVVGGFIIEGHGVENWPFDNTMQVHVCADPKHDCPPGPQQLHAMIKKTHLFPEGPGSRLDPLIQANARYCTAGAAGRAEAIMSSLGVMDWFKADAAVHEKDLVLGMYPLRFLQEALLSIGPDFLGTSVSDPSIWPALNPLTKQTGSMMPFYRYRANHPRMKSIKSRGSLPYHDPSALDPSVRTWQIQPNGSVMISQAVIFASNRPEFPGIEGLGLAYLNFWGRLYSKSDVYEFSEWTQQQPRFLDTFVVPITRPNPLKVVGLLLQGRTLRKKTRLVKIGTFELAMIGITESPENWPKVENVDWIVV